MRTFWLLLLGGLWAQETWEALRPQYRSEPLISAERPRLRDAESFQWSGA